MDVTWIQRYELGIPLYTPINLVNADVDRDDEVDVIDATWVQRFIAGVIDSFYDI